MMTDWRLIVGAVLILLGGLWFLQGVGVLGGSFMSGSATWAIIGPLVAIGGIALIVLSRRRPSGS